VPDGCYRRDVERIGWQTCVLTLVHRRERGFEMTSIPVAVEKRTASAIRFVALAQR